MTQLIDDHLLGTVLRGGSPPHQRADIFTTGYWYVRLCQAVLRAGRRTGNLSAPFASLPDAARGHAIRALVELPDTVGLVSLRDLAPLIGQLRHRHGLNILGMEVLAAAIHLQADVFISSPSPRLQEALRREKTVVWRSWADLAEQARFRRELCIGWGTEVEVVVLGSESREALENAHSRSFGKPRERSLPQQAGSPHLSPLNRGSPGAGA